MNTHQDTIAVTGNETLEELEALLESMEAEESRPTVEKEQGADEHLAPSSQSQSVEGLDGDTDAASPTAEPNAKPDGILAKDQKHIIPMEVLERERQEKAQLRQELEELKAHSAQLEKAQRMIDVRNKQLEELGVAPADLPEDVTIDEKKLAALQEDYPELAPFFLAMNNKIEALVSSGTVAASTTPPETESAAPVDNAELTTALKANADLQSWMSEGGARWNAAQQIDDHLASSSEWANRSYAERFEEVSKRVRLAFGDEPKLSAQEALSAAQEASRKAKNALPASPSELGNTHRTGDSDLMNRVQSANHEELGKLFDSLSEAQIEQLLYNAGF
ncbi:ATPase [Vibrio cholerae]|uniref:ATPase n=1 Tax=Vibrio cholerae TaxID=666 RepID=UPI0011D80EF2|nr:ATPase [Vibrio cholerae]EGR2507709.1 ATPase [Vibrio cholerae]EHB5527532.1 ATPase [Vibrio cholerae]EHS1094361.1 ATPase [Vibrio cholerae]EJL6502790.1 ATPase [Vibrio cholerae]EJL7180875.1 ATPase [Vibrio cholerae]